MFNRRIVSAAVALVGTAVGLVLSAAHTKKDLIDLRHEKWNEISRMKENRKARLQEGLDEYRNTPGAVLLDVREKQDYDEGHIPGAVYAELRTIELIPYAPDTPLFLYCYRGNRSAMAASSLRDAGFEKVKDIGGIEWYDGEREKA